jgi:hypothetical protein
MRLNRPKKAPAWNVMKSKLTADVGNTDPADASAASKSTGLHAAMVAHSNGLAREGNEVIDKKAHR